MTKLEKAFEKFDKENPIFWNLFENFALELAYSGRRHLSASLIVERIRWETSVTNTEEYKISNNHRAYYARKFNKEYADKPYAFILRPLKTKKAKTPRKRFVDDSQTELLLYGF